MKSFFEAHQYRFLYILLILITSCNNQDDRVAVLSIEEFPNRQQDFSFWQLEQFNGEVQMAYIIRTDDNNIVVVDGGVPSSIGFLEDYLIQLGGEVHTWITTHPHIDHIGVLPQIIQSGRVVINRIVHTAIDEELVRLHEPNSYQWVKEYYDILRNSQIPIIDVTTQDVFSLGDGVELSILGDKNDNILVNLVNNSSLVFKIKSSTKSVLFLGDLGVEGGNEILKNSMLEELKVDYVQMAHHGQDGVNRNFYTQINAKYALWPTPTWLWENNLDAKGIDTGKWKTLIVRRWMEELEIKKNYVSGIDGTIQID